MMWNYFIMFFYEAAFEVTLSIVLSYQYVNLYNKKASYDKTFSEEPSDIKTRNYN